jgi:hypothetical protein
MRHLLLVSLIALGLPAFAQGESARTTTVSIHGRTFLVNGQPTYRGRVYNGHKVEGLLFNVRLVQGIFDDENAETRPLWRYPDGREFDAECNTAEFIAAMPQWRRHGLLAFTINLQGGSPQGYSKAQPWTNSAFTFNGELKPAYMNRLERILNKADELGMVPIVGLFYAAQARCLSDEAAVLSAARSATDWLVARKYANVLVEIANECNIQTFPEIIQPPRVAELIKLVQERSRGKVANPANRLYVSTSLTGGQVPGDSIVGAADFLLLHGNGVATPDRIRQMVRHTRGVPNYREQPVLFNEDDHFDFDKQDNNFLAALDEYAGWGYFDYRQKDEAFAEGFQSVPADWNINSARKRAFFNLLSRIANPP